MEGRDRGQRSEVGGRRSEVRKRIRGLILNFEFFVIFVVKYKKREQLLVAR